MKNLNQYLVLILGLFLTIGILNSCVKEDEVSITEPSRYTQSDVKSYGDLFKVFWTVMDRNYNYFYEQKRQDGLDWNAVYKEYYPKFLALKTYNKDTQFNDQDIQEDRKKAIQYFTDIIDPIIDRHFTFSVFLPSSKGSANTQVSFNGGMKTKKNNIYDFYDKRVYMLDKLQNGYDTNTNVPGLGAFILMGGALKSNPDIHYISFNAFAVVASQINLQDKYAIPTPDDKSLLTIAEIDASKELNMIKDLSEREKGRAEVVGILKQYQASLISVAPEINNFNDQVSIFKTTEVVSDTFLNVTNKIYPNVEKLVDIDPASFLNVLKVALADPSRRPLLVWFFTRMNAGAYASMYKFRVDVEKILVNGPFYQKFLNPLHKGNIKKLIIDLRGNGGGAVIDFRFFVERFVTKNTVWGYQRTKQGNGRFNYTPWVPMQAKPHQFALPANIPIVILTDKGSVSMSEMSTMMLKSQGPQVISIGDFSYGGTAGLGNSDDFNSGSRDFIPDVMSFYMPLMATKDINGNVIEGIGVKPDIYVTPPTDAEVEALRSSPSTFTDRVMVEAVKYLSSK
ncbi:peptidase S41-like protein [Elizabethkingia sp. YR214]|uniref:S41 family peptidase n=1 Tax=Elizabethkingia sp. YR214 TaxID=2135667 RepID=UPI000D31453F|nr:S41 family peptidase [Elizabethkingia sp. YR214]PUB26327.1 peptidase S41-like protein [Elizabethkingia sp. YR214]